MVGGLQDWRIGRIGSFGRIDQEKRLVEKGIGESGGSPGEHFSGSVRLGRAFQGPFEVLGELWGIFGRSLDKSWESFQDSGVPWMSFGTLLGAWGTKI